jgi:UDPglucose 6-dehydrogenase
MNIGLIGLGRLGLPVSLAIESKGHTVVGYDPSPAVARHLHDRTLPNQEKGAQELLDKSNLKLVLLDELVAQSDIIFVAVQTPHEKEFEGTTPIPDRRKDFDYTYLCEAVSDLAEVIAEQGNVKIVVVVSTVLPGTIHRYIRPCIFSAGANLLLQLHYAPAFIAMGQVVDDYLNPEFVLLGDSGNLGLEKVKEFYRSLHDKPIFETTIETAELIKVAYNTYIGMKLAFANTVMEICHKTPNARCDDVTAALSLATQRLMSKQYLTGGMGDGGGCHPRDNIAMSWLARELDLSHNFFDDIMKAREDQTKWLADIIINRHRQSGLTPILLGAEFKPNTNITTGSPALLLSHYLSERGYHHIVWDRSWHISFSDPRLFFASCKHNEWLSLQFPEGSEVVDPWRWPELAKHVLSCGATYYPIGGMKDI